MTQRLTDLEITRVSLVDKGANARRLAVLKRDEEGSMTDQIAAAIAKAGPEEARAGVLAWLRKALGLDSGAVVKGAMPTTDAAMRTHLAAKTPAGHGMGDVAVADMSSAAMDKKHTTMHTAGADHSHAIAKAATFAEVVAGQELSDALYDSWYTLQDVLWGAIYAYDETGQTLSIEAKTALVAQDLDEFKAYLLAQMASVTVAKGDEGSPDQRRLGAIVRKVGKKISGSRLERLSAAAEALNSVLAEVAEVVANEAADPAEEVEVDKAEMVAAMTEALEPISKRLEALEKAKPVEKVESAADGAGTEEEEPVTLETAVKVIEKLADRLEVLEGGAAVRKSLDGQDGGTTPVKKSEWTGIL